MNRRTLYFITLFLLFCFSFVGMVRAEEDLIRESVTGKPAPSLALTEEVDEDGIKHIWAAHIYDINSDTDAVISISKKDVYITSYVDRLNFSNEIDVSVSKKIAENLEKAYNEITNCNNLDEIFKNLEEYIKEKYPNKTINDFVVTDLFDVSVSEKYLAEFNDNEKRYIRFSFEGSYTENTILPLVLHRNEQTNNWLAARQVFITSDGKLCIDLDSLCPVVFLTLKQEENNPPKEEMNCKCPSICPFCTLICKDDHCNCLIATIILIVLTTVITTAICVKINKSRK